MGRFGNTLDNAIVRVLASTVSSGGGPLGIIDDSTFTGAITIMTLVLTPITNGRFQPRSTGKTPADDAGTNRDA